MNNLVGDLEELKISGVGTDDGFWENCTATVQKAWVPQKLVGRERPCEEKDFRQYRTTVNRCLLNILKLLRVLDNNFRNEGARMDRDSKIVRQFGIHVLVVVGEQSRKNLWNNAESVVIAKDVAQTLCGLFDCDGLAGMLAAPDDKFGGTLLALRPKLLKDTWKTYPSAVVCYEWLLRQVQEPQLAGHIRDVLPTTLIIFDDFVPENRLIGLECMYQILRHCYMKSELMENGYAYVICDALQRLAHEREVRYIIPLYACLASVLATMEYCNNSVHNFEWGKRDDAIATILDNMECEGNLELRHAYMTSLPQLLTNIGCAKWCERLTRVLAEYCGNHTDLRTLKATLKASQTVLSMFPHRIPAHSTTLYTAFLKLHVDLAETPVFDNEITQSLESCICMLYELTPNVGAAIMRDDRMRSIIKNSVHLACLGDTKYCN